MLAVSKTEKQSVEHLSKQSFDYIRCWYMWDFLSLTSYNANYVGQIYPTAFSLLGGPLCPHKKKKKKTCRHLATRIDEHFGKDNKSDIYHHLMRSKGCLNKCSKDYFLF